MFGIGSVSIIPELLYVIGKVFPTVIQKQHQACQVRLCL